LPIIKVCYVVAERPLPLACFGEKGAEIVPQCWGQLVFDAPDLLERQDKFMLCFSEIRRPPRA
jgi:hypothetical protein